MKKFKFLAILVTIFCFFGLGLSSNAFALGKKEDPAPPTYNDVKYPIILVHGVCGFDDIFGIDYWYGIEDKLRDEGAKHVRSANLSAMANNELRGEQLLAQIKNLLADTGASKVNIIAHSHGCTTSRYVTHVAPELVASFTSIAGPHKGSPVAEWADKDVPEGLLSLGSDLGNILGHLISVLSGKGLREQDTDGLINHFDFEGNALFNSEYPSAGVPESDCGEGAYTEIKYDKNNNKQEFPLFSWVGSRGPTSNKSILNIGNDLLSTNKLMGDLIADWLDIDESFEIDLYKDVLDSLWPILQAINRMYDLNNDDGFVGVCSAHYGKVLKDDYKWNHGDEVNHLFGILAGDAAEPPSVISTHVNRLKNMSL